MSNFGELNFNGQDFPRKLIDVEKYWLYKILPENKKGYKTYRDKIEELYVIGYGKFPPSNLILSKKNYQPDLTIPLQPIIATGVFQYNEGKVDVTIFEEFEELIEVEFHSDKFNYFERDFEEFRDKEIFWFTYSNWVPGQNHPEDNSSLRLVNVEKNKICLAISVIHKRVWIYDYENETLKFFPITNFYQELLKVLKLTDPKIITDINYFFLNLNKFTDSQIKDAFINYNRLWKKIDIKKSEVIMKKKESLISKILKRIVWKK